MNAIPFVDGQQVQGAFGQGARLAVQPEPHFQFALHATEGRVQLGDSVEVLSYGGAGAGGMAGVRGQTGVSFTPSTIGIDGNIFLPTATTYNNAPPANPGLSPQLTVEMFKNP